MLPGEDTEDNENEWPAVPDCFFDGYVTAVAVAPGTVTSRDWMQPFVDMVEGLDESPAEAFQRSLDDALAVLRNVPEDYYPLYEECVEDYVGRGKAWASGFMTGISSQKKLWLDTMADDAVWSQLEPIAQVAQQNENFRAVMMPPEADPEPLSDDEIVSLLDEIPECVLGLYAYRMERLSQPVHAAKVGRNDPCPCGSGKKYKKCCGA